MSNSFENPFIPKPDNLKPDSAEFLQKYAGASDEQLNKAGVTRTGQPEAAKKEQEDALTYFKEVVSETEKEAYLDEIVEFKGIRIMRRDLLALESIIDQENKDLSQDEKEAVVLGEGKWRIGGMHIKLYEQLEGRVNAIYLLGSHVSSLSKVRLPERLRNLSLNDTAISTLDDMDLPAELQTLDLSGTRIASLERVVLPERLVGLYLIGARRFSSLDNAVLPQNLRILNISNTRVSSLEKSLLPDKLQQLFLYGTPIASLEKVILPKALQILDLEYTRVASLDGVVFPPELRELKLKETPLSGSRDARKKLEALLPKNIKVNF